MLKSLEAKVAELCELEIVTPETDLTQLDSLARADLIVWVEDMLGKQLTNEQIKSMKTFKDLTDMLRDD